jgi:formamidopyrimidine-DNA glycosylase
VPELPEVEVLVRHLRPRLQGRKVHAVRVFRDKTVATTSRRFARVLRGAEFLELGRRGKYLLFSLKPATGAGPLLLTGHLGMTGRMYLAPKSARLPKHAAVVLDLGAENFVFADTRYFGRLTLGRGALARLGPEPLGEEFTADYLARILKRSSQPIKVKLLDQALVAGVGNIYASESLFRAGISPLTAARKLTLRQAVRLRDAIRSVLMEAIDGGSTVPLDFAGAGERDGLFYFGRAPGTVDYYAERLRVYDRAGQPCVNCGIAVRRLVQAARSTFYCPSCQRR